MKLPIKKQQITKLRVEHCSIYTNCSSCLESRDPFCGWCSLEKRCTIRNACHKDASNQRWLSLGTGHQCIDFEMVLPNKIPINQMTSVQLVIRILPELPTNAKYKCVFGNSTPIDATVLENGLSCPTPPVNNRPIIPAQTDHVLVPLSVRSSETNKDFVSRSFAFFDCSRHDTCRQCVQSEWNCNWCLYDNRCVHNSTTCRNTASVISQSSVCNPFNTCNLPSHFYANFNCHHYYAMFVFVFLLLLLFILYAYYSRAHITNQTQTMNPFYCRI